MQTLLEDQASALEAALWTAVRAFKERHLLVHQLAEQEKSRGDSAAALFQEQAEQAERYGDALQQYILSNPPPPRSGEG